MPISLTFWSIFGSCGKMLKIFIFLNFFLKILLWLSLLTPWIRIRIRIRIRDPDPDPHQNFRSDPDPDPLQNKADPKPCNLCGSKPMLKYPWFLTFRLILCRMKKHKNKILPHSSLHLPQCVFKWKAVVQIEVSVEGIHLNRRKSKVVFKYFL